MITYTPQQLETIKAAHKAGLGLIPISIILGINKKTLRRILNNLGVEPHTPRGISASAADARYLARMSLVKIRDEKEAAIAASKKSN